MLPANIGWFWNRNIERKVSALGSIHQFYIHRLPTNIYLCGL
jgi:hypothetical protein